MKVKSINLINIKCFERLDLDLSEKINVFIGANNSGKSTILKSLLEMQYPESIGKDSIRKTSEGASMEVFFSGNSKLYFDLPVQYFFKSLRTNKLNEYIYDYCFINNGAKIRSNNLSTIEPNNFIYPHLADRKVSSYNEIINLENTKAVTGRFNNLYPKIDRLASSQLSEHQLYKDACSDILGIMITTIPSRNGKKGGYTITDQIDIPIDSMGEGVYHIAGLLADLTVAKDKLFLIEEPENDLHPQALKKLLDLIIQKSDTNQFVITTHSNIVVKHLGIIETTNIFKVSQMLKDRIPTSTCTLLKEPEQRREALEELGYEIFDYDMWEGWIFFEESSAERIVRDFIIPEFFPRLQCKIRTYSATSITRIDKKFDSFNDLFVFLHLSPVYKNKVWVILDNGKKEKAIIDKMKSMYVSRGWDETCFIQFSQHDFESYYPECFQEKVKETLAIENGLRKQDAKKQLLYEVLAWINEDRERARREFENSAKDVIEVLRRIEDSFN